PENLDLGDVRNLKEARTDVLDVVAQLAVAEAIGGEAVDEAVSVAEVVVESGCDDARRQRPPDVANVLAHLVPDVRHRGGGGRALEIDENGGEAGARIAADIVEPLRLLQLALEPLGHLG